MPDKDRLFPEKLMIQQGSQISSCYLLAALDAVLTTKTTRNIFESMFSMNDDGTIELRIKRQPASRFLDARITRGELVGKYRYRQEGEYDVFILTKGHLNRLEKSSEGGVITNSLAVKIFEHISTYYFKDIPPERDDLKLLRSIDAHNILDFRYEGSYDEFVAKLIGLNFIEFNKDGLDLMIKLNSDFSKLAACIVLTSHENSRAHAYRIEKVIKNPDSAGGYDVVLVNPYDNTKRETFSLDEIKARGVFSSIFRPDTEMPGSFDMMLEIKKIKNDINDKVLDRFIKLAEEVPGIVELFHSLNLKDKVEIVDCMFYSLGEKQRFMNMLQRSLPDVSTKLNLALGGFSIKDYRNEMYNLRHAEEEVPITDQDTTYKTPK